jgi:RecA-family ATPase
VERIMAGQPPAGGHGLDEPAVLQLAVAVATGGTFLGRPVKQGGVIVLSAEDDEDELHRRIDDILRFTGQSYSDLEDLTVRSLAGEDALLALDRQLGLTISPLLKNSRRESLTSAPLSSSSTRSRTFTRQ